jgi:hypothetical protein
MNLCQLVTQLADNMETGFGEKQVINEIHPCVEADTCQGLLKQTLCSLLKKVTDHNSGKAVKISAKTFHNLVVLQVKYNDPSEQGDLERKYEEIEKLAGFLGGSIYINNTKIDETTVSITFLDHQISKTA